MNFYRLILSATLVLALAGCGGLGKSNLEPDE